MYQILYVSRATKDFSPNDLGSLLEKSRKTNTRLNVTGLLLYKDGNFMQMLEGDEDPVLAVYYKIMLDPRHDRVVTMVKEESRKREFTDWSMGFKNLDDPEIRAMPGYNDFMNVSFVTEDLNADMSRCKRMMSLFKNGRA